MQCSHSYKWDQHVELFKLHTKNAAEVDKPIAGLLKDLKARGLFKDTLVIWGGEFGRTPWAQGSDGRDHNPYGYTIWMAGAAASNLASFMERPTSSAITRSRTACTSTTCMPPCSTSWVWTT